MQTIKNSHYSSNQKKKCSDCINCSACQVNHLSVSCGCDNEAKQFEYRGHIHSEHHDHGGRAPITAQTKKAHSGHASAKMNHADHAAAMSNPAIAKFMEEDMRRRFFISLILSIPTFLYSPVGIDFFKLNLPTPIPVNLLLLIFTTPIVLWAGSIFISGTYHSLRAGKLNMSVLIFTGVMTAYLFSLFLTFTGGQETFYEAAALLVTFVLFGHWMEMRSRRGTSDALRALFDLVPPQAIIIRDGREMTVASAEIINGDVVIIKPGNKIPVDGEVVEGDTYIDESLVTGESLPVHKASGSSVVGGSINKNGTIKFKATKVGSDTVLAQIIKLVESAQNSKAPGQRIADKAAAILVIVAIGSGLAAFIGWYVIAGVSFIIALTFAVSTIVIACPDALGLATPTAVAVGTGIGAKHNILIKDATTLEKTAKINAIVMDKTGTLTKGQPEVTDVVSFNSSLADEAAVFQLVASIEKNSEHPLASTIIKKAVKDKVEFLPLHNFAAITGQGVKGTTTDNQQIFLGNIKLLADAGISLTAKDQQRVQSLQTEGKTVMILAKDKEVLGVIAVADTVRDSSKRAVELLQRMKVEIIMITGDNIQTAQAIAAKLGIERVFADVLPADKANWIKKLQTEGKFVAMVGDGINDAPALAQSDIGIAIGAGTDVAIETASIVLMKSDPLDIVAAIRLSKATVNKMRQNLFWAAIYNLIAIPFAAGVFYNSLGWSLRPEISALLMSVSSIVVATNAVLLKRVEPKLTVN